MQSKEKEGEMIKELEVSTSSRTELVDVTSQVERIVSESGEKVGRCLLFVPHTTAAITINENADPSVKSDILMELNKIVPFNDKYTHREGNAAAHIKSSIIGCEENVLIEGGRLVLGTWQGIFFCEFDGPRRRHLQLKIVPDL